MSELVTLFSGVEVKWIVTFIVINIILGIIGALVKKDFRLGKLADFMHKPILGYVFGYAVIEMVAQALPSLDFILQAAFILIILALAGSIVHNLGKMGLALPSYLKKD